LPKHLAEHGHAWAASGFRAMGYRPDWFVLDILALRARFIRDYGQPRWTIIRGQSMGGHVAVAGLELHPAAAFQGGLIECGIDGVGRIDSLCAYTAAAEYFSGLPLLDTPRPTFGTARAVGQSNGDVRQLHSSAACASIASSSIWPAALDSQSEPARRRTDARAEFSRHANTRHIRYDIDEGLGRTGVR
jgi:pimeloyl-ACP methyl ester carboxylesterase